MSLIDLDRLDVVWAYNRRGKASHAFVKGAATGDGSICGRAFFAADADVHSSFIGCAWCQATIDARTAKPHEHPVDLSPAMLRLLDDAAVAGLTVVQHFDRYLIVRFERGRRVGTAVAVRFDASGRFAGAYLVGDGLCADLVSLSAVRDLFSLEARR